MEPVVSPSDYSETERDLLVEAVIDEISPWYIAHAVRAERGEGPAPQSVSYTPELGDDLVKRVKELAKTPREEPGPDTYQVIRRSLEIINRFLTEELVYPSGGTLSPWGEAWSLTKEEALTHIEREWRTLDRAANIGDIVTLGGTEKGGRLAITLWPEQFEGWRGTLLRRVFPNI